MGVQNKSACYMFARKTWGYCKVYLLTVPFIVKLRQHFQRCIYLRLLPYETPHMWVEAEAIYMNFWFHMSCVWKFTIITDDIDVILYWKWCMQSFGSVLQSKTSYLSKCTWDVNKQTKWNWNNAFNDSQNAVKYPQYCVTENIVIIAL